MTLHEEQTLPYSHTLHPIFMPRNEEETIRNLILLLGQIKYVRDLPQASIHFERQTDDTLAFTVLTARLLKKEMAPLRELLEKVQLKMDIDEVRTMGCLLKKHPKEGAILRITVDKRPFFRPDHSVDLLRARQEIVRELTNCLGKFRDFNGGMILKQDEALRQLRQLLGNLTEEQEFLLENYFYSLKPAISQTVHDVEILKRHHRLLTTVLHSDLQVIGELNDPFFLCFIAARTPSFKEHILSAIAPLKITPRNLTSSFLEVNGLWTMGFILHSECAELIRNFRVAILDGFEGAKKQSSYY